MEVEECEQEKKGSENNRIEKAPGGVSTGVDEDNTRDSAKRETKKRKAESTPEFDPVGNTEKESVIQEIGRVSEAISKLWNLVSNQSKGRKDIKELVEKLDQLRASVLESGVVEYINKCHTGQVGKQLSFEQENYVARKMYCERCAEEIECEEEKIKEIVGQLKEAINYEEEKYKQFINKDWPEKAFLKSKVIVGNPFTREGDLAFFLEDKKEESALTTMLRNRFPEVDELLEDENESDLQFLESVVSTKKGTRKKRINLTRVSEELNVRQVLVSLRDINMLEESKTLSVAVSRQEIRDLVRKSLEVVFAEWDIDIEFFVPTPAPVKTRELSIDRRGRNRRSEAVIIKTDVTTYAETLRNIRAVVNPEDIGVEIKSVKMTKDNKVVIVTEEGKAEKLHKEIASKVKGIETRVTGSDTAIVILDIDASINGKEVEDYIRKTTKEYETHVRSLRTGRGGTQIATVTMPSKTAEELLKTGDIRIGWTRCRVRPRVEVIRCYNCLAIGHHSEICKEPKTEKKCLNCARTGHLAKECTNRSFCNTCRSEGHRSDSTLCPSYRNLLQGIRKEKYGVETSQEKEGGDEVQITEEEQQSVNLMDVENDILMVTTEVEEENKELQ
ncbi:hypothetical protein M8J77_002353 [Diaphorina citri]|nr:hypothetical protein M8J77_002353 [Diaphorina citri]